MHFFIQSMFMCRINEVTMKLYCRSMITMKFKITVIHTSDTMNTLFILKFYVKMIAIADIANYCRRYLS